MVQKIGLESSTNCFTMVSHHTKLLRMHLAVISSPGKVSEQNSSGFRKRCGLEAVAAGDDKGFIPSTGALRDCLNVVQASGEKHERKLDIHVWNEVSGSK